MLEKHMTLDKSIEGQEHFMCADPERSGSFGAKGYRFGKGDGITSESEFLKRKRVTRFCPTKHCYGKSIKKGQIITEDFLDYKRLGIDIMHLHRTELMTSLAEK